MRRWGEYPFEIVQEQIGTRRKRAKASRMTALPGFSFAILRDPFDRLVSAYTSYITVPDKATAVKPGLLMSVERGHKRSSAQSEAPSPADNPLTHPDARIFFAQVYRAWIRELHHLGEKDPITFSHFVRWVVQQEPAVMHRPWQPYSETCRFGHVKYSFIGRVQQSVKRATPREAAKSR